MNLVRWNNRENSLLNIFDDLMNKESFLKDSFNYNKPAVNISENEKSFDIDVAVPGMKKDDFKIKLDDDILVISSEKELEKEEEGDNFKRKEFTYGAFCRSFTLPKNIETKKINANYNDGILKVVLPKKEVSEEDKNKIISIS